MPKFVLKKEHTWKWPVKVRIPHPTRIGTFETHQIDMFFRAISNDEAKAISAELDLLTTDEEIDDHKDTVLRRAITGWDEQTVSDDEGNPIPFSTEALNEVLQFPWGRLAAYEAYGAAISGGASKGN